MPKDSLALTLCSHCSAKYKFPFAFVAAIVVLDMSQGRRLKNANVEKSVKETRKRDVGVVIMLLSTIHVSLIKQMTSTFL